MPQQNGKPGSETEGCGEFQGNLEDVLISLQKSFSRLSARTGEVGSGNAAACIQGTVHFVIKLRVQPTGDFLKVASDGEIELSLEGKVEPDVRLYQKKSSVQPD